VAIEDEELELLELKHEGLELELPLDPDHHAVEHEEPEPKDEEPEVWLKDEEPEHHRRVLGLVYGLEWQSQLVSRPLQAFGKQHPFRPSQEVGKSAS